MNSFYIYYDVSCQGCETRVGEMFSSKAEAKEWTKARGWKWKHNNAFCPNCEKQVNLK